VNDAVLVELAAAELELASWSAPTQSESRAEHDSAAWTVHNEKGPLESGPHHLVSERS
jgi:hypothetical protein